MCHQREALNTPPPEPDSDDEIIEENNEHDEAPTVGEKRDACMQTEIKKVYVKRIQTEELDLKPIQRTIGTMTDFRQTPVLKLTATMTEDVVQKSVGTETDAAVLPLQCNSEDQQDTDSEDSSDEEDEDWLPDDESGDDYDEAVDELDITDHQEDRAHRERKCIVYESCLKELLSPCRSCQEHCRVVIKSRLGSFVRLLSSCAACGFVFTWGSQPLTSRLPSGNLEVAGSILFSGASVSKALQLFNNMNIMCISERTFRYIQSSYLIPAVRNIWIEYQRAALQQCVARDVKVGGDARC
ncbi:uncharacterized protein LOC134240978 [Saccostrea cucullata]|uniref:uncharacterized protein LOC134240978 n=1 Tax=Saccostrea cuccullata TaxID=36930 RepID=UPI002ED39AD9